HDERVADSGAPPVVLRRDADGRPPDVDGKRGLAGRDDGQSARPEARREVDVRPTVRPRPRERATPGPPRGSDVEVEVLRGRDLWQQEDAHAPTARVDARARE